MRSVIFRGKRIDIGEWVYGYYIKEPNNTHVIRTYQESFINAEYKETSILELDYEVDEKTIGQYTGFKDRNNISIFEFDIIRLSKDLTATVRYNEKMARFEIKYNETTANQVTPLGDWIENYEVINNY